MQGPFLFQSKLLEWLTIHSVQNEASPAHCAIVNAVCAYKGRLKAALHTLAGAAYTSPPDLSICMQISAD